MIKVLYISDTLKQRFGVTSVIMNYINYFDMKEIKVDLLVYDDSEPDVIEKLKCKGCNVYFMPKLSIKSVGSFKKIINNFFENNKYDIVHSHFNQVDSIIFPIARKNGVKYCISHSHNTKLSDNRIKAIRNRIMCFNIGKNADYLAACSEAAGNFLYGKKAFSSDKRLIINNGVDCSKFSFDRNSREEIRKEFNIDENSILIGNIGSFKIQKNQSFLIDIFNELSKLDNKYILMLVGDGEKKSEIIEKVINYGLKDKVIFTGVRKDIPKILSALDAFILPSLYEGLPVIGIEAQASGLECVFSNTITKEVDLTGVIFVDLAEPVSKWAEIISKLSFKHDESNYNKISKKGYDIKRESKKLESFYKNIMTKNK